MTDRHRTPSRQPGPPSPRASTRSPRPQPGRWRPSLVACGRIGLGFLLHIALMWVAFVIDDHTRPYSGGWISFTSGEMTLIWAVIVAGPAALCLGVLALASAALPQHPQRRIATRAVSYIALGLAVLTPVLVLLWV